MVRPVLTALLVLLALPGQSRAADPVAAFAHWATGQGADGGAIAVLREGAPMASQDATTARDLASNSKAITALCVLTLVDEGRLDWDMTIAQALDRDAPDATLAQLVTHSAGIAPDGTQLRMRLWLNEETPRHGHVTDIVLDRRKQRGTVGTFQYNNENYALLGAIIAHSTGQPYEAACTARVLEPAGVSGALSPRFAAFGGWGGWRMSMEDHARLLWHWFGPQGRVGADPLALPVAARADGSWYGLGMGYRDTDAGMQMSHAGALSFLLGPKTGAYAVVFPDGVTVATAYDEPVASVSAFRALDQALSEALSSR
ncbi:serine hydrolase domain-containing protein [Lacimonas salitolerans]|uniref:Serine hydrolase domain-containing protein n=1 Tax=Lacimonas salitolerans TaxID=1323750 RepID=A0ABW4EG20_9RHOB